MPPVSPLICYEMIFPGSVIAQGSPRPEWMVNISNDGWYGNTSGPRQHFIFARFRAVEEGLPPRAARAAPLQRIQMVIREKCSLAVASD